MAITFVDTAIGLFNVVLKLRPFALLLVMHAVHLFSG